MGVAETDEADTDEAGTGLAGTEGAVEDRGADPGQDEDLVGAVAVVQGEGPGAGRGPGPGRGGRRFPSICFFVIARKKMSSVTDFLKAQIFAIENTARRRDAIPNCRM